jgi:hypothetical protein
MATTKPFVIDFKSLFLGTACKENESNFSFGECLASLMVDKHPNG